MKRKFIIISKQPYQEGQIVYFKSTTFRSSDWDAYGSTPAKTIKWASQLQDANLFVTREEAMDTMDRDISELTNVDLKYIHIVQLTDKQRFKAILTGK